MGGILRDVLCNDVPLVFRSELYATVSIVTGGLLSGAGGRVPVDVVVSDRHRGGLPAARAGTGVQVEMPKFVYDSDLHK